ncbi:hypothetical protein FHS92_000543 [Sphingobium subterraneum]|uniref:Rod shape-determining protein MreD n=2 Tax=Sphingobium subterraneum TaxID=627688 RepID=A0A841IZY2_9SPHN|nr:hypothetical protein [Sphingobium subterraneum]
MARFKSFDIAVFTALALVMLITRSHSLSQIIHLPDTSLASFFVAGFYIRSRLAMPALFALGLGIDLVVINVMGGSDFCFTPAYWMLAPAYGVMWIAGRFASRRFGASLGALPVIGAVLCGATFASELLSSGGFYWLGGRFAEPTLAEFLPRIGRYFPGTLISTLIWAGVAAACHAVTVLMTSGQNATHRK